MNKTGKSLIRSLHSYQVATVEAINGISANSVAQLITALLVVRERRGAVYVAGNGGSASTASHMVTDIMLGSRMLKPSIRVVSLSDNVPTITATGNDIGFQEIFARPLLALGDEGDLLIVVSASGNSVNLLRAVDAAKKLGMVTAGILAFDGGILKDSVDITIHVPTPEGAYGNAEDAHLTVNHMIVHALQEFSKYQKQYKGCRRF